MTAKKRPGVKKRKDKKVSLGKVDAETWKAFDELCEKEGIDPWNVLEFQMRDFLSQKGLLKPGQKGGV